MSATETSNDQQTIRLKIKRQDGPNQPSYWDEFEVPYRSDSNIISCLLTIASNPVNAQGHEVAPVVWDCNCLEEVCGACTMLINGRVRQSCSALIRELLKNSEDNVITLEPMSKFPVVRDLWVDRNRMFEDLKKIKGWVPIDGTHNLGPGPKESPEEQDLRYSLSRCMTCGCCVEACPEFGQDRKFMGPQILAQVHYFNAHETGKVLKGERLNAVMGPGGVTDCGNAQNCVKVCPKEVPLTTSIGAVGRQTTVQGLKNFFDSNK